MDKKDCTEFVSSLLRNLLCLDAPLNNQPHLCFASGLTSRRGFESVPKGHKLGHGEKP